MKIAFVASEIAPFASTGGLAEVGGSLPRALEGLGAEVLRIMPLYRRVLDSLLPVRDTGIRLKVPVGFRTLTADVWHCEKPGPTTYFIRRDEFFDRSHLYNLPDRDYDDNFERFIFFQKAAVALLDHLGARVDIVHANDWQTGLVPLYLEHGVHGRARGRQEKTVFTIHNLAFQGIFPGSEYASTNLPFSCFSIESLEYYGKVNCLKAGVTSADAVTTVSRTYAEEIQQEGGGYGLHGLLHAVRGKLTGIVNGIDHEEWDPTHDPHLAQPFSADDLSGKRACRTDVAQKMGLRLGRDQTTLIGMVSRLSEEKGFGLLAEVVPWLMETQSVSLMILGQGGSAQAELCRAWAEKWPGRVAFREAFDRVLGHQIIAGSDLFLMPSRQEPCGLSQLFSLRYGTIPVVHATGGLRDTVEPVAGPDRGYGFRFEKFDAEHLQATLAEALAARSRTDRWTALVRRAMAQDFSWTRSARAYLELYESLLKR